MKARSSLGLWKKEWTSQTTSARPRSLRRLSHWGREVGEKGEVVSWGLSTKLKSPHMMVYMVGARERAFLRWAICASWTETLSEESVRRRMLMRVREKGESFRERERITQ